MANLQGSMNTGFQGIRGDIAAKSADDRLSNCQLRYDLTQNDNANARAILAKIDQVEDSRKDREIAALTAENASLKNQNAMAVMIGNAVAPLNAAINGIRGEVDAIRRCQTPTITLPNNQYTAVPTLVANAGADFISSYWANRLSQATSSTTSGTGAGTGTTA